MARHFNKPRRDDMRPSSRHPYSNRYREERPSQPGRPRPNRNTVDRAWESGARPHHADYHTRETNGQAPRGNRQHDQQFRSPSTQYGRNNRKPYSNRQDNDRRFDRSSSDNRSSYNPQNRRFNDRRNYSERPYRQERYENTGEQEQRSPYENGRQGRGYQQRSFNQNNRYGRNFERNNEKSRSYQQRDSRNQHPRSQSRPAFQRQYSSRRQESYERPSQDEQFEGDYERFHTSDTPRHSEDRFRENPSRHQHRMPQQEERHVTRLPDGRVLKGPRPAQRKNAKFWSDVANDTQKLVSPVETSSAQIAASKPPTEQKKPTPAKTNKQKDKTPPRKASALVRGKKAPTRKSAAAKPRSNGPKPSQRGFKWPTS